MLAAIDKKFYKIIILFLLFVLLTTFNPEKINFFSKKKFFFKVQNISIINNFLINESEIKNKLSHVFDKNIFFIKKEDISKPLKSIDFLDKIEVKKKYPNDLIIKIYETKPLSILIKKNEKYLLDSSSNLIPLSKHRLTEDLPAVFGKNAENYFVNFYNLLQNNNFPKYRVKNYYYFQIGRWDLQLKNNKIIKFPPNKINKAIQQSIKLLNREDFMIYNTIDLRIHGKIVVE